MEFVLAVIGFIVLALVSWWTDKSKKARDYYDGDNDG